ncbi:MAG: hypothetical protein IM606_09875 [Cytophagales bacterium]|nr:hypothetical protein [Cytophagales bacterium]
MDDKKEMSRMEDMEDMEDMKEYGRGTDTVMGHLSLGEVVIPRAFLDDPQVMQTLKGIFDSADVNMAEFTVGDEANKINPETKQPEFFLKGIKSILKSPVAQIALPIAASVLAPGVGSALSSGLGLGLAAGGAGATALGAGALGTGLGLASGQNIGQALKGGAISGGLSYGGSLLSESLADTALGRGLSDLKAGAADTMVGRGISDIGKSASGALDSVTGGLNDLYQGSSVQDAFRSGSDALKSVGIDVGSSATTAPTATAGGASSYAGAVDPSGKYSFGGGLDKIGGTSTAALNESTPLLSSLSPYAPTAAAPSLLPPTSITESVLGAAPVAKNSINLSPLLSAGLGYVTNESAANDLLEQQRNNAALASSSNKAVSDALLKQYEANTALFQPYASGFEFTPGDLTADPGYQFQLTEGNRAADRASLARGNYYSGQALKEAQQFGQGLADTTYNSAFNRALQGRAAGLQGATAAAGVNTNYGTGTANQAINNAALLMGINENIGNVNANRTVNTNNLISGALGNLLGGSSFTNSGALQGGIDLQELLRRNRMGSSSYAS